MIPLLRWIEVEALRNLAEQRVDLAPGLNLVTGRNAQGKSSLLEAVYLLATTRSFRTERPDEAVRHGAEALVVRGEAGRGGQGTRLAIRVGRRVRELRVDGSEVRLEAYLGRLDVIAFSSRTLRDLLSGPAERRRYLDRGAVLLAPGHLGALRDFRRTLAQRNRLLRDLAERRASREAVRAQLAPWDGLLAGAASEVAKGRADFASALAERAGHVPGNLLPERGNLVVAYRAGHGYDALDKDAYRAALGRRLADRAAEDLRRGFTSSGPQRDDLILRLGGRDLLTFGSSGQLRATLIGLLLAQMELVRERKGGYPVLLLDDVDSDIDEGRYTTLMEALGAGHQALVASSKGRLPGPGARRRFLVETGRVQLEG